MIVLLDVEVDGVLEEGSETGDGHYANLAHHDLGMKRLPGVDHPCWTYLYLFVEISSADGERGEVIVSEA